MDKVSVIVPVCNRRDLLRRSLDSIAAQSWRPLEVIVVDNGSDDGSYETACAWGEENGSSGLTVKVMKEPRKGVCRARNRGLSEAVGRYCVFFDSDDSMRPGLVDGAMCKFMESDTTRIVCWRCVIHQLNGTERLSPFYPQRPMECHLLHSLLRTHGYMAPTDLFRDVGGWNEKLDVWNDWELGVRILIYIYRSEGGGESESPESIAGIDYPLADIFCQPESITGMAFASRYGAWEESIDEVRRLMTTIASPDRERWLDLVTYRRVALAAQYKKEGRGDLAVASLRNAFEYGNLSPVRKVMYRILYHYISRGGRGGWRMV